MNSSSASGIFREILETQQFSHPLEHVLQPKQEEVETSEPKQVGFELEFVPLVISSVGIPEGFELGEDGGGTMPELRRNDGEALHFDGIYKKQLFDLWYFARLGQVRASSIHLHFDPKVRTEEELRNLVDRFANLLGSSADTVRNNYELNTAEVRLNLSAYRHDARGARGASLDLAAPFFEQEFDVVGLIEVLIDYAQRGELDKTLVSKLPHFWQARLEKMEKKKQEETKKPMQIAEIMSLFDTYYPHSSIIESAVHDLESQISYEDFIRIADKTEWSHRTLETLLYKLGSSLTYEQIQTIIEKLAFDRETDYSRAMRMLVRNITYELTYEQVIELFETSLGDIDILYAALAESRGLTLQQSISLIQKFSDEQDIVVIALERLSEEITYNQVIELKETLQLDDEEVALLAKKVPSGLSSTEGLDLLKRIDFSKLTTVKTIEIIESIPSMLNYDEALEIIRQTAWNTDVLSLLLKKIDAQVRKLLFSVFENIPPYQINSRNFILALFERAELDELSEYEKVMYLLSLGENRRTDAAMFLEKVDKINYEQFIALLEKSDWYDIIFHLAVRILDVQVSYEQVLKLFDKFSGWEIGSWIELLEKLNRPLLYTEFTELAEKSRWNRFVVDKIFEKIGGSVSYDQVIEVFRNAKVHWSTTSTVLKKLDGVLTYSQVVKMADVLVLENDKSEFTLDDVFEKLDKVADYQQALELCSMYSWDSHACVAIIEKFGESLSYDQAFELLEATRWNQNILPVVLKKVDGLITYEQMFSLLQKYPSWYRVENSEMLMEKMPDSLTQEQVFELIESFGREIIFSIFKKLPLSARLIDAFSIKKLLNLLGKKKWAIDWTHLFEQPGKKMYPLAKFIET